MKKIFCIIALFSLVGAAFLTGCAKEEPAPPMPAMPSTNAPAAPSTNTPAP